MKPMGRDEEQQFAIEISGVKVDLDKSGSIDSFSSNPGSNFNRGADKFIEILEKQLAALRNIERESKFRYCAQLILCLQVM